MVREGQGWIGLGNESRRSAVRRAIHSIADGQADAAVCRDGRRSRCFVWGLLEVAGRERLMSHSSPVEREILKLRIYA